MLNVTCDFTTFGGGWTLLAHQALNSSNPAATPLPQPQQANINIGAPTSSNLYSIIYYANEFRDFGASFEFLMEWPGSSISTKMLWRQSDITTASNPPVVENLLIPVEVPAGTWWGLLFCTSSFATYCGRNSTSSKKLNLTLYYPIMQNTLVNNSLIGPSLDHPVSQINLWVRRVNLQCSPACISCYSNSARGCLACNSSEYILVGGVCISKATNTPRPSTASTEFILSSTSTAVKPTVLTTMMTTPIVNTTMAPATTGTTVTSTTYGAATTLTTSSIHSLKLSILLNTSLLNASSLSNLREEIILSLQAVISNSSINLTGTDIAFQGYSLWLLFPSQASYAAVKILIQQNSLQIYFRNSLIYPTNISSPSMYSGSSSHNTSQSGLIIGVVTGVVVGLLLVLLLLTILSFHRRNSGLYLIKANDDMATESFDPADFEDGDFDNDFQNTMQPTQFSTDIKYGSPGLEDAGHKPSFSLMFYSGSNVAEGAEGASHQTEGVSSSAPLTSFQSSNTAASLYYEGISAQENLDPDSSSSSSLSKHLQKDH